MTNDEFRSVSNIIILCAGALVFLLMSISFNDRLRKIENGADVPEGVAVVYSEGTPHIAGHTHLDSMVHMNCEGCAGFFFTPDNAMDVSMSVLARLGYAHPTDNEPKLPSKGGTWAPTITGEGIMKAIKDANTERVDVEESE